MGATIADEGNINVVRLTGMLRKAELDEIQWGQAEKMTPGTKARVLVIAEKFEGWQKGDAWGDIRFLRHYGDNIDKLAVVADAKWEDQFLMFTGAGFRKTKVQFYTPDKIEEARAWLA